MSVRLSILIVTLGRETLPRTLDSIRGLEPGDEVLVIGKGDAIRAQAEARGSQFRYVEDGPFGNCGQRELQNAIEHQARGTHILVIGDDDVYMDGALQTIRARLSEAPHVPHMFRMLASPSNSITTIKPHVLWEERALRFGNVGGQMFVVPNDKEKIGAHAMCYWGDLVFMETTLAKYPPDSLSLRWHEDVVIACREWAEKPSLEVQEHIRSAVVSKTRRKFLCICEGGNHRSVGMAFTLKQFFAQDALAASWRFNSPETLEALGSWADYVVVMEEHFAEKIPATLRPKVIVVDVGPDVFGAPLHADLRAITYHAANRWRDMGWEIKGDTSSYRARENAQAEAVAI